MTPRPKAQFRLFCFPHAGGDALVIYKKWPESLPPTVEVCTVQMPGRGARIAEPPFTDIQTNVKEITAGIRPYLDKPFAFFGHSMGALLSFEVSRLLKRQYGLEPAHLFVSGRTAPHIPKSDPPTYNLPEREFLEEIKQLNGTPPAVLGNSELMQLMLPVLRADFEACQVYRYTEGSLLSCPLTAFGGIEDEVTTAEMDEWGRHTTGSFQRCMFPGGHFFINTQQRRLLEVLLDRLL